MTVVGVGLVMVIHLLFRIANRLDDIYEEIPSKASLEAIKDEVMAISILTETGRKASLSLEDDLEYKV